MNEDLNSRPMRELRERLQPELVELIKQQRLRRLCEGTCFKKISSRRKQEKFCFCRLSPNHKVLHYGDVEEFSQEPVPHETLQHAVSVVDMQGVLTGRDCPHLKEKGVLKQHKEVHELAFSILHQSDEFLSVLARDKYEFCIWTDGLNALLGKDMTSELTRSEMDMLVTMEMKLRLLDLDTVSVPEAPPPLPTEPSDFHFVYDYSRKAT